MPLDFPTSPTNGQIYDNYYWDNTNSVWRLLGDSLEVPANFSNTATGTYTDGFDYKYVSFTADGVLTVTRGGYADILLVGGGGAGATGGGGGGGGGCLYIEGAYLPVGNHNVVVGAGGLNYSSLANYHAISGNNGEPSMLGSLYYAPGGGGGASRNYRYSSNVEISQAGLNGGSGGGASGAGTSWYGGTGGQGVPGLGYDGGAGKDGTGFSSAGGGGAGGVGQTPTTSAGGNGGPGRAISITGSSVTYAGGGGGCGYDTNPAGSGGAGGGGAGGSGSSGVGTAGTNGLGGGGGGNWSTATGGAGGDGGSGIVIVRVRTN